MLNTQKCCGSLPYLQGLHPHGACVALLGGYEDQAAVPPCVHQVDALGLVVKGQLAGAFHYAVLQVNQLLVGRGCDQAATLQPAVSIPLTLCPLGCQHRHAPSDADVGMGQDGIPIQRPPALYEEPHGLSPAVWNLPQSQNEHLVPVVRKLPHNYVGQADGYLSHLCAMHRFIEDTPSVAPQHRGAPEDGHSLGDRARECELEAGLQRAGGAQRVQAVRDALLSLASLRHQDARHRGSLPHVQGALTFDDVQV